jgi:hypothetical protein
MEISNYGASNAVLEQKQSAILQQVQVSMFKKALDMNTEGVLALVNAATQVTSPNTASNPPNLGQNIDTTA